MSKIVIRRVGEDGTKADRQREEALSDGSVPDGWLPQLVPFGGDEEEDAVRSTLESHRPYQQRDHDDIRKYRKEIRCFPRALHSAIKHSEYRGPAQEEANSELPGWHPNSILDGVVLV